MRLYTVPCTLYPVPCTLYPCTLYPVPCSLHTPQQIGHKSHRVASLRHGAVKQPGAKLRQRF
jgi:hypothetical protein